MAASSGLSANSSHVGEASCLRVPPGMARFEQKVAHRAYRTGLLPANAEIVYEVTTKDKMAL